MLAGELFAADHPLKVAMRGSRIAGGADTTAGAAVIWRINRASPDTKAPGTDPGISVDDPRNIAGVYRTRCESEGEEDHSGT